MTAGGLCNMIAQKTAPFGAGSSGCIMLPVVRSGPSEAPKTLCLLLSTTIPPTRKRTMAPEPGEELTILTDHKNLRST